MEARRIELSADHGLRDEAVLGLAEEGLQLPA